jgi:hypothetical protein
VDTLFATVLAAVAAGASATVAAPASAALVQCGTVSAAGHTWHVGGAGVRCPAARRIVVEVAGAKPDRALHARDGEVDQYERSFSGLRCSKSQQTKVGGAINCTSTDGKQSVFGIYKSS